MSVTAPEMGPCATPLRCRAAALDAGPADTDIVGNGLCILSGPLELYPNA